MMRAGRYNLKGLYQFLSGNMEGVSANVFISNRPPATDEKMEDFVVIALPSALNDRLGCGDTSCRISLFARDIAGKWENTVRLSQMQDALYAALPFSDSSYTVGSPAVRDGGSDNLGFHVWHITLEILIK